MQRNLLVLCLILHLAQSLPLYCTLFGSPCNATTPPCCDPVDICYSFGTCSLCVNPIIPPLDLLILPGCIVELAVGVGGEIGSQIAAVERGKEDIITAGR